MPHEDISLCSFVAMNPDMSFHLNRARKHFLHKRAEGGQGKLTVKRFLQLMGAHKKSRPELLSMWCCFAGDRGFCAKDFLKIGKRKAREWTKYAEAYSKRYKVSPLAVIVAQGVRCGERP